MMLARRSLLAGLAAATVAPAVRARPALPAGVSLSEEDLARGQAFLARHPTVDIHAHPGRFFAAGAEPTPLSRRFDPVSFADRAAADIRASGIAGVMVAGVADYVLLGPSPDGPREYRPYKDDEAWADYDRQVGAMKHLGKLGLPCAKTAAQLRAAHARGSTRAMFSMEGGDFIEQRLERIDRAARAGVRAISLVHYRINQIGDVQTESAHYGGLSEFGVDVVSHMNRAGIIVDLAHASFAATADAAAATSRPMIISHTNLMWPGVEPHPRLLTLDHAKLVTDGGGLIGAVPAGFGGLSSFDGWIDVVLRMVEGLGADHVGIGTDMDFTLAPVLATYRHWPVVAAALLNRGLGEADTASVMGGNFLRVLAAHT